MFEFTQFYNQQINQSMPPPVVTANSQEKVVLSKNNIRLQFYFAGANQYGYKLSFIVHIVMPASFPGQIRASQIDMVSMRKAILENVDEGDRKYMFLKDFTTNKAEFYFNYDKWIKDAMADINLQKEMSIFNRKFKLAIQPPKMIRFDSMRSGFVKFIEDKIKKYIIQKKLDSKKFVPFLPKEFSDTIKVNVENLFNYEYDMGNNWMYVRLKPEFVIAASLVLAKVIKDVSKKDQLDPKFFDASVKQRLSKVNKDWDMKINKRF